MDCSHLNEIIDIHTGDIICFNCGLIKDVYYIENKKNLYQINKENSSFVDNILDKFNITEYYSNDIKKKFIKSSNISVKKIASEIYKTVNQDNSILPLKTVMNVSRLKTKDIKSNNIHILDVNAILEKYTKLLNLDFRTYTLIKEKLHQYSNTGFQPLTLIGGVIYIYCNENKQKISMKKIAYVLGISPISIQRFVKHVLSSRC